MGTACSISSIFQGNICIDQSVCAYWKQAVWWWHSWSVQEIVLTIYICRQACPCTQTAFAGLLDCWWEQWDGEGLRDLVMCDFVRQTEGRHMGVVLKLGEEFWLSCFYYQSNDWRVSMAVSILFIVRSTKDSSTQNRINYCWAPVYPLSTWCNCMWPNLPGLPPPHFNEATCSLYTA